MPFDDILGLALGTLKYVRPKERCSFTHSFRDGA